jgi:hypothetical protein
VPHPVSDLATATAGDAALPGVAPHTDGSSSDGSSSVGFEAAGQHAGITNLFNRLNGTTPAGSCA